MDKVFFNIYQWFQRNRPVFWGIVVATFGILALLASQISFEEDISKLIPKTVENKQLQEVLETANFSDKIIVHFERKDSGTLEDLTASASIMVDSIRSHFVDEVLHIQGIVEDENALEALDFVHENLPLFLSTSNYAEIEKKLNSDSIKNSTKANYKILTSPTGFIAKQNIARDPMGITYMGLQRLSDLGANNDFVLRDGFLVSSDEHHLLLFLTPSNSSLETASNHEFVERLSYLQKQVTEEFKQDVEISLFGGVLIADANAKQIKKDIQYTVGISSLVLMLFLILFYRKIILPLILFTPTIFGALLSVAFLAIYKGEISAISLGIGSILLGVTFDYSLHILTHLRNGESPKVIYKIVVKPLLMSSLSTALAFSCLMFFEAEALQDLGLFAAVSVLGSAIFALVFVPQVYKARKSKRQLFTAIDRLAAFPMHKNKWILGAVIIALVLSIFSYSNVRFNKDLSTLNFIPKSISEAQAKLDVLLDSEAKSVYVVATGNGMEEALQANDQALHLLQELKANGKVLRYNSVGGLVRSEKKQLESIKQWSDFWHTTRVDSIKKNLTESAVQVGFKADAFQPFLAAISKEYQTISIEDYDNLDVIQTSDFIAQSDQLTTVTTLVKVNEEQISELKTAISNRPNLLVVDRVAINETLLGQLKAQFNLLMIYSFLTVFILLILYYRNLKETLVTILPIVVTWCISLGIMGFLNIELNVFNSIITVIIFGLGIDYSIFITNGLKGSDSLSSERLITHKTSIILSVLTTLLGMGVMFFAVHPALYSISMVAIIGILTAGIVSFTIQPVLFHFLIFKGKNNRSS